MNISRHSLIFGLSYALDIAGKNNLSHSKSTAYISVMLGRELGLDENALMELYYAALLHDIGISHDEAAKREEYDLDIKRHCVEGEAIVKKLPLSAQISEIILYHHENYDGSGPFGLVGEAIPQKSQIILPADMFDNEFGKIECYDKSLHTKIEAWLAENSANFSEETRRAFSDLARREYFLLDYFNHETKYTLSKRLVVNDSTFYGYDDVVKYAHCFADIIDRRSPFTFTHSNGIAKLARKAAAFLGYNTETQDKIYIAGLLHDIGKLSISPDILHKNGRLTPEERFEINKHTYYTRKILEQVEGFEDIVNYAANHHEKLDGTGYPYHMPGEELSELDRVMAVCDVYQALTEERPYRENLPAEKVWEIIDGMVANSHLDGGLVVKLKGVFV